MVAGVEGQFRKGLLRVNRDTPWGQDGRNREEGRLGEICEK